MQGWFHGYGVFSTIDGMKFEGEFRGGRMWGHGLLTYSDGSPSSEGYFQESKFRQRIKDMLVIFVNFIFQGRKGAKKQ